MGIEREWENQGGVLGIGFFYNWRLLLLLSEALAKCSWEDEETKLNFKFCNSLLEHLWSK